MLDYDIVMDYILTAAIQSMKTQIVVFKRCGNDSKTRHFFFIFKILNPNNFYLSSNKLTLHKKMYCVLRDDEETPR